MFCCAGRLPGGLKIRRHCVGRAEPPGGIDDPCHSGALSSARMLPAESCRCRDASAALRPDFGPIRESRGSGGARQPSRPQGHSRNGLMTGAECCAGQVRSEVRRQESMATPAARPDWSGRGPRRWRLPCAPGCRSWRALPQSRPAATLESRGTAVLRIRRGRPASSWWASCCSPSHLLRWSGS